MTVRKGQLLEVTHCRKGKFLAVAEKTFNTKKEEFYPLKVAKKKVSGLNIDWYAGESIPCRGDFCKIAIIHRG